MIDAASYACLGDLLRDALIQFKTDTALIEVSRREERVRLSFLEVKRAVAPVGRHLQELGIGPGDRVAVIMSNQSRWLLGATAVLMRGAVLVPLDFKLSAEEQASLLAHARPEVLIVEHGLWRRFRTRPDVPHVLVSEAPEGTGGDGLTRWEDLPPADGFDHLSRTRDDVATVVYSSGTGGAPKGCQLTHGNYLAQWEGLARLYPMQRGDRFFSILPTNHAIDFMCGFVGPWACGGTVVHQRTLRPEFLLHTLRTLHITHIALVPVLLEAFERALGERLDALPAWKRQAFDALAGLNQAITWKRPNHAVSRRLLGPVHEAFGGELKVLFCGGAFVDRQRAELFYRLGLPVVIGYGLTEACTVVTVNDLSPFRADTVGRPVDGTEVRIAEPDEHGVGEVQVAGPTVMAGYLDAPELTAAAFDGRWLRTGDLGWLDAAGHLHLVGRRKNMIVTGGGKNVYPEDVEAAFDGLPCELAVFASAWLWPRHDLVGDTLVAVVQAEGGPSRALLADLRDRNRRLPEHKRVHHLLAWERAFPRTASLKLKREVLAAELRAEASPDDVASMLGVP